MIALLFVFAQAFSLESPQGRDYPSPAAPKLDQNRNTRFAQAKFESNSISNASVNPNSKSAEPSATKNSFDEPKVIPSPVVAPRKGWMVSPTIFYSAARLLRGATIWPEPSGMIVPGLAYADWFRLSQGGVQVYQKMEYLEYAAGLSYIDDAQPMFSFTKHKSDFRNERDPTYELVAGAKVFSKSKHEVSLSVHQDLKVHHGQYVIVGLNFPLLPLTSINLSYATADERHNHYIYGDGAIGGAAHFDISGRLLLPFLPGGGILILSWLRSQILQEQNRMASYINGENPNGSFSALATWTL